MTETAAARTWEPTMRLRWGKRFVRAVGQHPDGDISVSVPQLQQQWRCLQTHETEWRPIEVEP